jgi:hypothetical protein
VPCYLTGLPQGSTATYCVTWTLASRGAPCRIYDEMLVRFRSSTWLIQRAKGLGWNVYSGLQVALRHWSSFIWAAPGCRNVQSLGCCTVQHRSVLFLKHSKDRTSDIFRNVASYVILQKTWVSEPQCFTIPPFCLCSNVQFIYGLSIFIYIYIYIYIHTHTHIHMHTYIRTYIYIY